MKNLEKSIKAVERASNNCRFKDIVLLEDVKDYLESLRPLKTVKKEQNPFRSKKIVSELIINLNSLVNLMGNQKGINIKMGNGHLVLLRNGKKLRSDK